MDAITTCVRSGKVKHLNRKAADLHLNNLRRTKRYSGVSFRCVHCGFWHVGRPLTTARQEAEREVARE